jgi:intracellular septation protein
MKLLFDFLPILLFFAAFRAAEGHADAAASFASQHFGFLVSGGVVGPKEAPVLLATLVVIVASFAQIGWLLARRKKVDTMLWVSLGLVTVLGGLTVWFHNDTFIKWKPTLLYGVMGLVLWGSQTIFGKNLLQALLGAQMELPAAIWRSLNLMWIGFFAFLGLLNLYVAYHYETATWVNFKVFGTTGLLLLFTLVQGLYLSRHMKADDEAGP